MARSGSSRTCTHDWRIIGLAAMALIVVLTAFWPELGRSIAAQMFEVRAAHAPLTAAQRNKRERYWASKRGFQFGVPASGYADSIRAMRQQQSAERQALLNGSLAASVLAPSLIWNYLGPQPITTRANFTGLVFGPTYAASGRVSAIAIDPKGGLVVAGAASGGVWLSTDDGATFKSVFDNEPSLAVGAIALDPTTTPTTIYVATGEGNGTPDSLYGEGIFESTDLGNTWTQLPQPAVPGGFAHYSFTSLAIDTSVHPVTIYAGVTDGFSGSRADAPVYQTDGSLNGLWKSSDGGNTWTHYDPSVEFNGCLVAGTPCPADDVVIDPVNPSNVYVALDTEGTSGNPVVYYSHSGGASGGWKSAPLPIIPSYTLKGRVGLALGPASSGSFSTLYALVGAGDGAEYLGLFVSLDGGASWTSKTVPSYTQAGVTIDGTDPSNYAQSFYDLKVFVSPSDPTGQTLFLGGVGLYKSADGGHSWTFVPQNGGTHSDQHALQYDAATQQIFVGNDGGLFSFAAGADPSAITFTSYNSMINASMAQGLGVHPTDPKKLFAGFQGIGLQAFTGTKPLWSGPDSENGDGGFAVWDPSDPNYLYATFAVNSLGDPTISASTDGGTTWCSAPSASPPACASAADAWSTNLLDQLNATADPGPAYYPPLAVDPSTAHRVFFGAHQVYVSNDGMRTWLQQSDEDLTDINCQDDTCSIEDLEFAPSDHTKAWALAMADTLGVANFALTNTSQANLDITSSAHGGLWTDVTANLPSVAKNSQATSIAPDPFNPNVAYLALSGFTSLTGAGHIYKTQNFGATWQRADGFGGVSPLGDVPVLKLLVDATDSSGSCPGGKCSQSIYAATDIGIFHSADGGQTWQAANNGGSMPTVPVYDLQQNQNGTVFAATHGRGVFQLGPPPSPTPTLTPTPTPTATASPIGVPSMLIAKPNALNFPTEIVGSKGANPSKPKSVILSNPKNDPRSIVLGQITLSGINFSSPSIAQASTPSTCSKDLSLAPGSSCQISVVFSAINTGNLTGTLKVEHNGLNNPVIVNLRGKGVLGKIGHSPSSIRFPKTTVGTISSKSPVVTLSNPSSNKVPLSVVDLSLTGKNPAEFTATSYCGSEIPAGKKCTITTTFTPAQAGNRSAILKIAVGATPSPITINLSGTGG